MKQKIIYAFIFKSFETLYTNDYKLMKLNYSHQIIIVEKIKYIKISFRNP